MRLAGALPGQITVDIVAQSFSTYFIIMSSHSEYRATFSHIIENWLQTETSEIGHLLQAGEVLRRLRAYPWNSGLMLATYVNEDGDNVELSDEQYEELGGLSSYLNYLRNNWGPESQVRTYDYTQRHAQTLRCSFPTTLQVSSQSNSIWKLPWRPCVYAKILRHGLTSTVTDLNHLHPSPLHLRSQLIDSLLIGKRDAAPSVTILCYPDPWASSTGIESCTCWQGPMAPTWSLTSHTHLHPGATNMRCFRP